MITVLNSNKFSRTESTQTEESLTEFEVKTFVKLGTKEHTFIKLCKYSGSEINDVMTLQKRNDDTKPGNNARSANSASTKMITLNIRPAK